jgi:hypothetical protein
VKRDVEVAAEAGVERCRLAADAADGREPTAGAVSRDDSAV